MGDHDYRPSCLSDQPHDQAIRDPLLHYFGCLRENEKKKYFDSLKPHKEHYQHRIKEEEKRIREQRALFETEEDDTRALVKSLRDSLRKWRELKNRIQTENDNKGRHYIRPSRDNGFGMKAYMMFYKNSTPFTDPTFPDKFPNQKISVEDLLIKEEDKTKNPLMRPCGENEIRYFHLPGNNMEWIEEAIARHYNEKRPPYDGLFRRPEEPSKTYMLLRPEFWRGQQHGGRNDAVHARHMRPRCDAISTDPENLEDSPKNLVLFMPYLHWETDRRRAKFEEIMRKITEKHKLKQAEAEKKIIDSKTSSPLLKRDQSNQQVHQVATGVRIANVIAEAVAPSTKPHFNLIHSATEAVDAAFRQEVDKHPGSKLSRRVQSGQSALYENLKKKGMLAPKTALGQVFHRAAVLSEAMDYYQEEELLKEYLHNDPPFHARRTLDQSYYWTLRSTKKRDQDQVIFRGTASNRDHMKAHKESDLHTRHHCTHCRHDSRKVPRVIMVDQLWLWILDGNTIITSFPKRYGRNKPDPSAVHKSIRIRLKNARKNEIRSVYDLALIIIDECAKVFFDRTKTADRQPQVMDIFAEAIGNITNRQTIAYAHFWETTKEASKIFKSSDPSDDIEEKTKSLLDINPEGTLLREIKDILDELHIMINIKSKQQRVFKEFIKHIKHMIATPLALSEKIGTAKPKLATRTSVTNGEAAADVDLGDDEKADNEEKARKEKKAMHDTNWTLTAASDLSTCLDDRVTDLENLKASAEHAEKALNDLLGLKQQQAGVVQAREAVRQAEETLRQGRSIMLFTVITIIFLPLSFGTGIFGMNSIEFSNGNWSVAREFTLMIPVSIGVIFLSFVLAFSTFTRAFLSFIFELAWIKITTTPFKGYSLYAIWTEWTLNSQKLTKIKNEKIRKWKERARVAKHEKKAEDERRMLEQTVAIARPSSV